MPFLRIICVFLAFSLVLEVLSPDLLFPLFFKQGRVPGPVILDELRVHRADIDSCIVEILNNLFIVTGSPCLHPLNFGDVLYFSSICDILFDKSRNKVERGIKR